MWWGKEKEDMGQNSLFVPVFFCFLLLSHDVISFCAHIWSFVTWRNGCIVLRSSFKIICVMIFVKTFPVIARFQGMAKFERVCTNFLWAEIEGETQWRERHRILPFVGGSLVVNLQRCFMMECTCVCVCVCGVFLLFSLMRGKTAIYMLYIIPFPYKSKASSWHEEVGERRGKLERRIIQPSRKKESKVFAVVCSNFAHAKNTTTTIAAVFFLRWNWTKQHFPDSAYFLLRARARTELTRGIQPKKSIFWESYSYSRKNNTKRARTSAGDGGGSAALRFSDDFLLER